MNSSLSYSVAAFAPNSWCGPWMNRQQILSRLAARAPVVYSTGSWFVWDRGSIEFKRAKICGSVVRHDGVWVETPPRYCLRWPRVGAWDHAVVRFQMSRLRRFIASIGSGPLVAYIFHPSLVQYVQALRPDYCVYHAYDLFSRTPGWNSELAESQRWLLRNADLTIASSAVIGDALRAEGAKSMLLVPNGADTAAFSRASLSSNLLPEDLAAIPSPRIGYTGNLNRKVDFPLIERLAIGRPDWHFVFVGGLGSFDEITDASRNRCLELPNVHFLGTKSRQELPAYVAAMDVNIMCYRTDSAVWTEGIYPLKLHEYLATGRPVVSTAIPSVQEFESVVSTVVSEEAWEQKIEYALHDSHASNIEARRETARLNDWDKRVEVIANALEGLVNSGRSSTARRPPHVE